MPKYQPIIFSIPSYNKSVLKSQLVEDSDSGYDFEDSDPEDSDEDEDNEIDMKLPCLRLKRSRA